MPTFGSELRRLRGEAGLTMKDLAQTIDCSIAYISDIERDRRSPLTAANIRHLCIRLGKLDALPEMLRLAAVARKTVEFNLRSTSRPEEIDLILAFKRRIDQGTLSEQDATSIREILDDDLDEAE